MREADKGYAEGKSKFHGWTNPLSWRDAGDDDDLVLVLMTANGIEERRIPASSMLLQYEESEGPTKADLGENDNVSIEREADNDYMKGKAKFHGWTNPLGWRDDGTDDETVM